MTNELSTERAIEALYTVRAYYASLTAGYPKGKDCRGIGDVMCSEIANSCLMGIEALEQKSCEDCISRQAVINFMDEVEHKGFIGFTQLQRFINELPSVTPQPKIGRWEWVQYDGNPNIGNWHCSECRTIMPHMPEGTDNTPIYKWCPMCGAKMEVSE